MNHSIFHEAIKAIDSGNLTALKKILDMHPGIVRERLEAPAEGYFKHPYLLWFIANNPIRNKKLPANIVEITRTIMEAVEVKASDSREFQFDYTLGLVATGRISRESGSQIELMDLLIDAGAKPGRGLGALAHGNIEAAKHLIKRGGELTLGTAVGIGYTKDEIKQLAEKASINDKQVALVVAAFFGKADILSMLIKMGADPNAYLQSADGFHSHATALHQAVFSGSLDAVKVLAEAGAKLDLEDRIYNATPVGWAEYSLTSEDIDDASRKKFTDILSYLQSKSHNTQ